MSERSSTPSSFLSGSSALLDFSLSPLPVLDGDSGEGRVLRGVNSFLSTGLWDGEVGFEPPAVDALLCDWDSCLFSASLFSRVPRSVRPLSSSVRRPDGVRSFV